MARGGSSTAALQAQLQELTQANQELQNAVSTVAWLPASCTSLAHSNLGQGTLLVPSS